MSVKETLFGQPIIVEEKSIEIKVEERKTTLDDLAFLRPGKQVRSIEAKL